MATVIVARTIGGATETAAQLNNSCFARQVALPASWAHIRVGIRYHFGAVPSLNLYGGIFALGFCSGTTNLYGDASTTHFAGMQIGGSAALWTFYNVSPPYQYQTASANNVFVVKVATVVTASTTFLSAASNYVAAGAQQASADRCMLFLDLVKGSPNYTFTVPFYLGTGVPQDATSDQFLGYMQQLTPAPTGYTTSTNALPMAVSEATNGYFNAASVYWNQTGNWVLEVCDFAVAVLA